MTVPLIPTLAPKVEHLLEQLDDVPPARIPLLEGLAREIRLRTDSRTPVRLNFICTHNSRRSQLGQVWAAVAAQVYGVADVETFSGGTEATAFNPRAVAALIQAGFALEGPPQGMDDDNPRYLVRYAPDRQPLVCFSKVYDSPSNPTSDFLAVMTCGDADENCPVIPGATRIALTYEDPKVSDGTPLESQRYEERSDQIARELLWVFRQVVTG